MRKPTTLIGLALAMAFSNANAGDLVYRCRQANGRPLYTASVPAEADCQAVKIDAPQPNPAEVKRMQQEQQAWEQQRAAEAARQLEERRLRAQESAAQAAAQAAQAAAASARAQHELLKRQAQPPATQTYYLWSPLPPPLPPIQPPHSQTPAPQTVAPTGANPTPPTSQPAPAQRP